MKKLERIAITTALLSSILLSLYHISSDGFMHLTATGWAIVWSVAVNFLSLSFVIYIITKEEGYLRYFWGLTFIPYFIVKMIYEISAYGQIYIIPTGYWKWINFLMIDIMLTGFIFYIYKCSEKNN